MIKAELKLLLQFVLNSFVWLAHNAYRSLSFSSSGLTTWIPQTFTVTSEYTPFYFLVFLFYTF